MDRRVFLGSACATAPWPLAAQPSPPQTEATEPPPPLRLLVFDSLTPLLGERIEQALRATAASHLTVERVAQSASMEPIQARLRQWLRESSDAVAVALLPSQHWLGLGLLRPHLAIAPSELAPIAALYTLPIALAAHAALGVRTPEDLAQRLRQRPHQLPAAVWGWSSPSHWLAMLWISAMELPLRWALPPNLITLDQWVQSGRCALAFLPPGRLELMSATRSLMPLAAWSTERIAPTNFLSSIEPLMTRRPRFPDPCFVTALVPSSQAGQRVNQERHFLIRDWLLRAMQTETMQRHLGFDGGHDISPWAVPVIQVSADGQRRAFEAAAAQGLEGGRS